MTAGPGSRARLFVLDNYDSFTWNLVHRFRVLGARVVLRQHDRVDVDEVLDTDPDGIVIAPGPGRPEDAGIALPLVRAAAPRVPLLGVCLGHQVIAEAFGGRTVRAGRPMHGVTSRIAHDGSGLFAGLPDGLRVTRYHSLVVDPTSLAPPLRITARAEDRSVMALAHATRPIFGVQFHPEALLTLSGDRVLERFVERVVAEREAARAPAARRPARLASPAEW